MLKKASYAFTLIELLIYLATFSFFAIFAFGLLIQTQRKLFADSAKSEKIVRQALAFDLLKRDLICASSDKSDWDIKNFVFKKTVLNRKGLSSSVCVGWKTTKEGLYRIEGDYSFILKKWVRKIVSRVNNNFLPLNFVLEMNNDKQFVNCIKLNFAGEKESIFLKNRRV